MIFSASPGLSLCQCSKDVLIKFLFVLRSIGTGEQRQGCLWREGTVGEERWIHATSMSCLYQGLGRGGK